MNVAVIKPHTTQLKSGPTVRVSHTEVPRLCSFRGVLGDRFRLFPPERPQEGRERPIESLQTTDVHRDHSYHGWPSRGVCIKKVHSVHAFLQGVRWVGWGGGRPEPGTNSIKRCYALLSCSVLRRPSVLLRYQRQSTPKDPQRCDAPRVLPWGRYVSFLIRRRQ